MQLIILFDVLYLVDVQLINRLEVNMLTGILKLYNTV